MICSRRIPFSKRYHCFGALIALNLALQVLLIYCVKWFILDTHSEGYEILKISKELAAELNHNAVVDKSKLYKVINIKSNINYEGPQFDITLVTQCSSNHLYAVKNLTEIWDGPISVAVYSELENLETTIWDLVKFHHCSGSRNLKLHLVVPVKEKYSINFNALEDLAKFVSCNSFPLFWSRGRRNYNWTYSYPVNLLRNVAKKGSSTDYILVVDVDMTPSSNLRSDFLKFIQSKEKAQKEVYVVPIFENQIGVPLPRNKIELKSKIKQKQARPFYAVPCKFCQKLTKYGEWLLSEEKPGTRILYEVYWRHPWEPFFIARRDVPDFDERFKQYGMNRVSQICELYVAGYQFFVLDNIFIVHNGFKSMTDFHKTKNKEMEDNRKLYATFKAEVKLKYPESEKSC